MMLRLASYVSREPGLGVRTVRLLRAYRNAQERLRMAAGTVTASQQLALACQHTGEDPTWAAMVVRQWIEEAPLGVVRRYMRTGLTALLRRARDCGLALGVLSDYPAAAKLTAMGVRELFDIVRWAQEPEIDAFKPDARGLKLIVDAFGIGADEALHIGDRPEVDNEAARRAGMPAAIIGRRRSPSTTPCLQVGTFEELAAWLGLT
jgi:FMN phosphatase YigB (HAD superfamily)